MLNDHSLAKICLQALGVPLVLHGNCQPLVARARECYGLYEVPVPPSNPLELRANPQGDLWAVELEGRSELLALDGGWPRVDDLIQIIIERQRKDLAFVHGCCVSCQGKAGVLVGGSTSGKTTLGLGLQNAGCSIVADDVTPLRLESAKALQFHTGMAIRDYTRQLMGMRAAIAGYQAPIAAGGDGGVAVRCLFFLQHEAAATDSELSVEDGVDQYDKMVRLCYGAVTSGKHQTGRLRLHHPASFDRDPVLSTCSTSEALSLFFRHLHPNSEPAVTRLPALSQFFKSAEVLVLRPGRLNSTIDLVMRKLSGASARTA